MWYDDPYEVTDEMRMRKKPNLIPRMERCAQVWVTNPEERRGSWRGLMPSAKALHLELGCGKGRFTAGTAAQMSDTLLIAVERVPDAMVIAMERVCAQRLSNVFFVDGDAARLTDFFAPGEVDKLYINFCDPWPGKKHAKRRLTHPNFLGLYRQILAQGGTIQLKTDNKDLFEWSLLQFPQAGFEVTEVTRDLHRDGICGIMTDYEEKFHAMGTAIQRCVARMVPLPDQGREEAPV